MTSANTANRIELATRGWTRIVGLPGIRNWATEALPLARAALAASDEAAWRCGGTWFAGVDALPSTGDGSLNGAPLPSQELMSVLPYWPPVWHKAQLSVVRPGYPQPWTGESQAAFAYRRKRDAAHVDGLLPEGPNRRRHLREPHAFILGLPLTEADAGASPLVVWDGSHHLIRKALTAVLQPHPADTWGEIDVTEAYHAARREAFAQCQRIELPSRPGEALLLHRMVLHGTATWAKEAQSAADGRMIAYLRPCFHQISDWLEVP